MEFSPLYVIPVVGGYAFSVIWSISKYDTSRASGHKLYFRSIFYGVVLYALGFLIHMYLLSTCRWYSSLIYGLDDLFVNPHVRGIWTKTSQDLLLIEPIVLGPLLGGLLNIPVTFNNTKQLEWFLKVTKNWQYDPLVNLIARLLLWKEILGSKYVMKTLEDAIKNNDFEILLARAVQRGMPVMFTLDTGKLYVGWMVRLPNPAEHRTAVRILPMLSGYRNRKTHEVYFTHNYQKILEKLMAHAKGETGLDHLEGDDFEVVLPYEKIVSSHLFDPTAYKEINS